MSDFQKMMADLQQGYLEGLDQKIRHLQAALNAGDNIEIRETFHKLKGTGATYGVPEISQLGETIEILCVKRPMEYSTYIPPALQLLKAIQTTRASGVPFELDQDPHFQSLAKIRNS